MVLKSNNNKLGVICRFAELYGSPAVVQMVTRYKIERKSSLEIKGITIDIDKMKESYDRNGYTLKELKDIAKKIGSSDQGKKQQICTGFIDHLLLSI